MAAKPANAMNLNSTTSGLANWDGTSTMSSTALTQYYVLSGASSNTVNNIAPLTSTYVLTSNGASSQPTFQALPFTKMPWTDETTTFSPSSNNGYYVNGNATATLPASPAQGDVIKFVAIGAITLTITANTGQYIQVGTALSASAGTCANAATTTGCGITLYYRAATDIWYTVDAPQGTWTVT